MIKRYLFIRISDNKTKIIKTTKETAYKWAEEYNLIVRELEG